MGEQKIRVRRVGTVTFGAVLVVIGALLLIYTFYPHFALLEIMKFWPVILISLGAEVLWGYRQENYRIVNEVGTVVEQSKVVYDVAGILLMVFVVGCSMYIGLLMTVDWKQYLGMWG